MNISTALLATVVFIFFLLPGFIFLRVLWGSDRGYLNSNNFYNHVMWATLVSSIIYFIAYLLFGNFFNINITDVCGHIIYEQYNSIPTLNGNDQKTVHIQQIIKIITFSFITDAFSLVSVLLIKGTILKFKLDVKKDWLNFKNEWFYVLTGRKIKFKKSLFPNGHYVQVHLLCEVGGTVVIYKGTAYDYKLKDQELEYLYLTLVQRTGFAQWENAISALSNPVEGTNSIIRANNASIISSKDIISGDSIIASGDIIATGDIKAAKDISSGGIIHSQTGNISGGNIKAAGNQTTNVTESNNSVSNSVAHSFHQINTSPTFYELTGNFMIFKASEIKNIHISYEPIDLGT